jgi:GTP cyclohydrolase II
MHQVLDSGQAVAPMEQEMQRDDGGVVPVEVVTMPFVYDGKPATLSILHDLTERKRAEAALREREREALDEIRAVNESLEDRIALRTRELTATNRELEAANRDLESFSYSVAHDLRAPLRSMTGFAKLLELDIADGDLQDVSRHTERIIENAARMNALVEGLLAVSRMTHGALREEPIDFSHMVAEIARELNPGGRADIRIEALPMVKGDVSAPGPVIVRMHAANLLHDTVAGIGSGDLQDAMRMIDAAGRGVVVIIRDWRLTNMSEQVKRSNDRKVTPPEIRDYGIGAQILADLGVRDMVRLSNNPRPIVGLEGYGLRVVETRPLIRTNKDNA